MGPIEVTTEDSRTLTRHTAVQAPSPTGDLFTITAVQALSPAGDLTGPATGKAATPTANRGARTLKGLSHEIDFKNFDNNLQNLA